MTQTSFADPPSPPVVTIYTDGGCDPNPGPGGWAAILRFDDREVMITGNDVKSTNNRMELEAAIGALAYLNGQYGLCQVNLHTDSQYVRQGITQWIDRWFARNWKTTNGQPVKNQDLWHKLYDLTHQHRVKWHWVRGHSGDLYNERVDRLACQAREGHSRLAQSAPRSQVAENEPQCSQVTISVGVSYLGHRGRGGWAAVLRSGQTQRVLQGNEQETTSNALILHAATAALEALRSPCTVTVYTVSDYLGRGASEWVQAWQQNQWKTRQGTPVKHRALWEALIQAAQPHHISWSIEKKEPLPADLVQAKEVATKEASGG